MFVKKCQAILGIWCIWTVPDVTADLDPRGFGHSPLPTPQADMDPLRRFWTSF